MRYISTRGAGPVSGARAIIRGLAPDGGLYVPEVFPELTEAELSAWSELDYPALAAAVLTKFLPEFGEETLAGIARRAAARFSVAEVTPLVKVAEDTYFLELWHGPTHAFKDVALTTLPLLLAEAKRAEGDVRETLVLVATSGDTGKAALEGFRDAPGMRVAVLYPSRGVSPMQRLQMITQRGDNVRVWGVEGNFDDAQTAVKSLFVDPEIAETLASLDCALSSANSINLGRLLPQIVYYFSAYFDLANAEEIAFGDRVNFCVPTGNFGDILAGYYARRMGLPVGRLICASNSNNVLTDFLAEGGYNADRPFYKTMSPSMDILVSSNLERLLFEATGRSPARTAALMRELTERGGYRVADAELAAIREVFAGESASEEDTAAAIEDMYASEDYVMDPHTAVASFCADSYQIETGDTAKTVVLSTASPYKFVGDVLSAIGEDADDDLTRAVDRLEELTALEAPESLRELPELPVRFREVLQKDEIKAAVLAYARREKE